MAKKRIKKHILDLSDQDVASHLYIIGINSHAPLHKIIYNLNKSFQLNLYLHPQKIHEQRKKRDLAFHFYTTPENDYNEQIFIIENEILIEIDDTFGSLFSSSEAFYLVPELENVNYLLYLPQNYDLNIKLLQKNFNATYQVKWIDINMDKILTPVPLFPIS